MQAKRLPKTLRLRMTALHILRVPSGLLYSLLQCVTVLKVIQRQADLEQHFQRVRSLSISLVPRRHILLPHLKESEVLILADHQV